MGMSFVGAVWSEARLIQSWPFAYEQASRRRRSLSQVREPGLTRLPGCDQSSSKIESAECARYAYLAMKAVFRRRGCGIRCGT